MKTSQQPRSEEVKINVFNASHAYSHYEEEKPSQNVFIKDSRKLGEGILEE